MSAAFAQDARDDSFGRFNSLFVDDAKDFAGGPAQRLLRAPAGQAGGDGVEEGDPDGGIGSQDRVSDAGQGDAQPLAVPPECLFRALALRYRSPEEHNLEVSAWTWKQQLEQTVRHIIHKAYTAQLPADVENRLAWLSSGQMQAAKQLLAEAEAQAGRIAVSRLAEEIQAIERLLASLPAKNQDATHTIVLPYGTVRMNINRRAIMEGQNKRQDTPPGDQSTALEKVTPGGLLRNAIRNLDQDQVKRISEKAADEAFAIEVEKARADQRFDNASRDMQEFVHQAERLDQHRTADYTMHGEFRTASGTTSVRVSKEGSKVTVVIAVIIGLVLLLLFLSRH